MTFTIIPTPIFVEPTILWHTAHGRGAQQVCPAAVDASQILEAVGEEVHRFIGDAEQSDDLTILAIRYMPKMSETDTSE